MIITNEKASKIQLAAHEPSNLKIKAPSVGDLCPVCRKEYLDYDGLLNLVCQNCGFVSGGCFT